MNRTNNLKSVMETLVLTALALILILLSNMPVLILLFVVAAVPVTVLTARQGIYAGIASSVLIGLSLLMMYDPLVVAANTVMFGLCGVATGYMIQNKWHASKVVFVSTIFFSIGLSLMLYVYVALGGVDFFSLLSQGFDQMVTMVREKATSLKLSQEDIKIQTDAILKMKEYVDNTKPAILISYGFAISAITFFTTRPILKKSGVELAPMVRFRDFKLPASTLPGLLLIIILTWLSDTLGYVDQYVMYMNLAVIFSYVFAFQGASTLAFLTASSAGNVEKRAVIVGFGTLLLVLLFGLQVLSLVGLMDAAIDIRKLYQNRKG